MGILLLISFINRKTQNKYFLVQLYPSLEGKIASNYFMKWAANLWSIRAEFCILFLDTSTKKSFFFSNSNINQRNLEVFNIFEKKSGHLYLDIEIEVRKLNLEPTPVLHSAVMDSDHSVIQ